MAKSSNKKVPAGSKAKAKAKARAKKVGVKKTAVKKVGAGASKAPQFTWADWANEYINGFAHEATCLLNGTTIDAISDGGLAMLGVTSSKSIIGRDFGKFINPEQLPFAINVMTGTATPGDEIMITLLPKKGPPTEVSICSIPCTGPTGEVRQVVRMRDASRELSWRRDVQSTSDFYRHLFDISKSMVCIVDGEGYILLVNEGGWRMLGLENTAALAGRRFSDIVHPDYQSHLKNKMANFLKQKKAIPMQMLRADAEVLEVEMTAVEVADGQTMVEVRDVTDRVHAAKALREREERLHGIVNAVADAIISTNDRGNIIAFNKAAVNIFGYSENEIIGQNISMLVGSAHASFHDKYLDNYKETGKKNIIGVIGREERGRRKDGSEFPLEIAVTELQHGNHRFFTGVIRDITERQEAEQQIKRAHDELEIRVEERTHELTQEIMVRQRAEGRLRLAAQVIENLSEGVVIIDPEFKIVSVNPAYTAITGYRPEEVVGKTPTNHTALSRDGSMFDEMWSSLERTGQWDGEFWNIRRNGEEYAERLSVNAIINPLGEVQQFAAVIADITKRKQDEEKILHQANYDSLTGLPNRSLFLDRLEQSIANMNRVGKSLALLFIDLDGFKMVNDTLGHDIGDMLLKETSERLGKCVRTGDTVARLGGDEFTILMPNLDQPKNAPLVAQRSLDALAAPFYLSGHEAFVSASIGITTFPDDATTAQNLLKNADSAMYRAKEQGKANYQFFTSDMNEEVKERMVIKNGLIRALENDELSLSYQPKLDIATNTISSVEALMRWNSPTLGSVSPVVFIPVLEESGMVMEVGEWAIRKACLQHMEWVAAGLPPLRVAVNLSARQLRDPKFVDTVKEILSAKSLAPEILEIEITESMLMSDAPNVVAALEALHDFGVNIAMDDFGTGYSSLSYLRRFPIDTIKIDRSFVADIVTSKDDAEIIRTIINMGKTLNRKVIAEGVEEEEQLSILREYGCDEIQGYLISPAMVSEELVEFYKKWIVRQRVKNAQ